MGLAELLTLALILFIAIPAPLFIVLYFITRWKQSREISRDDERMLEELWQLSIRLEDRMQALEKILEDEVHEGSRHR